MQALGVTAAQVNQQLRSLNLDSPGGRAQVGGGEQAIRVLGEARSARGLGDTQIMLPGGRFARLSDIANVKDSVGEVRSLARLNGRPATTFSLLKAKGTSDVTVMEGVDEELAKIRKENPNVTITPDLHHRRLHRGDLPLGHGGADRRIDPRRAGGVRVPA